MKLLRSDAPLEPLTLSGSFTRCPCPSIEASLLGPGFGLQDPGSLGFTVSPLRTNK